MAERILIPKIDTMAPPKVSYVFMKRIMDLVLVISALLLLSPLVLIICFLIRLDSPGPIFYKSRRVGKNGLMFDMFVFRTMYIDPPTSNGLLKTTNDPRLTRIGRFLRLSNIYTLPQFVNILMGDMSLVGPRPAMLYEMKYLDDQRFLSRFLVKPGITGLMQIEYSQPLSYDKIVDLDLEYVKRASIWFDIKIMFRTYISVLKRKQYV